MMTGYESWLSQIERAKYYLTLYKLKDNLFENELFYNTFMALGYTDVYSYYSVVLHERYYKEVGGNKVFVRRDGGSYYFEHNHEIADKLFFLNEEVPVKQLDPFHVEIKMYSTSVIKRIDHKLFL